MSVQDCSSCQRVFTSRAVLLICVQVRVRTSRCVKRLLELYVSARASLWAYVLTYVRWVPKVPERTAHHTSGHDDTDLG